MSHSSSSSSNGSFAGDITRAPIMVEADASGVKCNGGNAALGHPEVYYAFDNNTEVTCGYCGQQFVKKSGSGD